MSRNAMENDTQQTTEQYIFYNYTHVSTVNVLFQKKLSCINKKSYKIKRLLQFMSHNGFQRYLLTIYVYAYCYIYGTNIQFNVLL